MTEKIPVIDLFAGPGGLAEGFSSLLHHDDRRYEVKLSIEMDSHARETLKLRAFLRQFPLNSYPEEYYQFLKGKSKLAELYSLYRNEHAKADSEAWQATLGETNEDEIDFRIKDALSGNKEWVLIGGPPCQAYSLAGRSRVGGINSKDHRVLLYREYLRIIAAHQPAIFVMENVKGLLSAKLDDEKIFDKILSDLRDPSSIFPDFKSSNYRIYSLVKPIVETDSDYLIKSEAYGIPQKRHRVILLGIRDDIKKEPGCLSLQNPVSLRSVISDLPVVRSSIYREYIGFKDVWFEGKLIKKRLYRPIIDSFDKWAKLFSTHTKQLNTLMPNIAGDCVDFPSGIGAEYLPLKAGLAKVHPLASWYNDLMLKGVINHESRGHLVQDLKRYLFASFYAQKFKKFPRMEDYRAYGEDLLPDHSNAESGKFNDRFRVQLPDEPATTVTSHISKDGHYFIHYDPMQCRSFTVREAARIQTFPDNYFFCGSRTQQFHQVGNAVPPYLAYQISKIVSDLF
jgi:DNA (cytosine-5)-methyltransferase 1